MKKIIVCLGGISPEREVSLRSGKAVANALVSLGYEVETYDFKEDPVTKLLEFKPDLAFLALHGSYGEDGRIQGMLDILNIPYTGAGVLSSALSMSKTFAKRIFDYEKIPTPDFIIMNKKYPGDYVAMVKKQFSYPVVIKASSLGSSIGVYIVHNDDELNQAIAGAFSYDVEILAEKYIAGRELTVVVIGNDEPEALPVIEIRSTNAFYDYESKYTAGMYEHIIPAELSPETTEAVQELSIRVYELMGCRSFARVDFMMDENQQPWVMEINTIPGCTETSLVPDAARAMGMEFGELLQKILQM